MAESVSNPQWKDRKAYKTKCLIKIQHTKNAITNFQRLLQFTPSVSAA
ncbi:uncharacterized protein G2W53_042375 [Senna tora]|uniref:Uncharacterized protein n=1 Tax=Senna tora TaxID=362788 RepID=A0A834STS0_9FABA|nr:uncharacterized protein G2W53_042375 [Senna tora]